jgi:hypothetical protein
MGRVKLRDEKTRKKTIKATVKPALYALECDGCGRVFRFVGEWSSGGNHSQKHRPAGELHGHFDRCAKDRDGRGLGNMFSATVCSFGCAQHVVDNWKKIDRYKPYAKAKAKLHRLEIHLSMFTKGEDELVQEWEEKKEEKGWSVPVRLGI